jgi:hypothetical protein
MRQMIANTDIAKRAVDMVLDGYSRIEQSMKLVEECSTPAELADYSRAVGKVTFTILHEILEPICERNPALKPKGWDDD